MRVFVTGADGLVGSTLVPRLRREHEVEGVVLADGDVCDPRWLRSRLESYAPEAVVHLAAMTAVDRCEAEPHEAFRVNGEGTRVVAAEADRIGAHVLTLSTDYVFDGRSRTPYREDDAPAPLSVYGQSKLAGEEAVKAAATRWTVVRTAWLFGPGGPNFIETMLRLARERDRVEVVDDQTGSPTYTVPLAEVLAQMVSRNEQGLYHVTNRGRATWYELAREAVACAGMDADRIVPASTAAVGRPAPRPEFSVLDGERIRRRGYELSGWREAVAHYIKNREVLVEEER